MRGGSFVCTAAWQLGHSRSMSASVVMVALFRLPIGLTWWATRQSLSMPLYRSVNFIGERRIAPSDCFFFAINTRFLPRNNASPRYAVPSRAASCVSSGAIANCSGRFVLPAFAWTAVSSLSQSLPSQFEHSNGFRSEQNLHGNKVRLPIDRDLMREGYIFITGGKYLSFRIELVWPRHLAPAHNPFAFLDIDYVARASSCKPPSEGLPSGPLQVIPEVLWFALRILGQIGFPRTR